MLRLARMLGVSKRHYPRIGARLAMTSKAAAAKEAKETSKAANPKAASPSSQQTAAASTAAAASAEIDAYERKTPHEHVLLRPGMYVGQIEASPIDTWVYNDSSPPGADGGPFMEKRALLYSPALLKIFDEILVNAADNLQVKS